MAMNAESELIARRYELLEEIGRGGVGVIYQALDKALARGVAVKLLGDKCQPGSRAANRFLDEARITGQLQHPAIPPIHDVGTTLDGRPFLVLKFIKGQTLESLLKNRSSLTEERGRFLAIFEQICQAVAYAHSHHVIHRDLKPANVMVGSFGETLVMDWGLAKVIGPAALNNTSSTAPETTLPETEIHDARETDDATRAGSILGTPAYMPPEQAIGAIDQVDQQSDVFGLGAILCVILTGKPPFVGADSESTRQLAARARLEDAIQRLDNCGAEPSLVKLCKSCLAVEKIGRPKDANEVAATIAALRSDADERARRAEIDLVRAEGEEARAKSEARELRKRRHVQLALLGAIGLMFLAVGSFAWWQEKQEANRLLLDEQRQRAEERAAFARESVLANAGQVQLYSAMLLMPDKRPKNPADGAKVKEYLEKAVVNFETASNEFPQTATHRFYLGTTYRFLAILQLLRFQAKGADEALKLLEKAEQIAIFFEEEDNLHKLTQEEGHPIFHRQLRDVYDIKMEAHLMLGHYTEALKTFVKLHPTDQNVKIDYSVDPVIPPVHEAIKLALNDRALFSQLKPEEIAKWRLILLRSAEEEQSKIMFATNGKEDFPRLMRDADFLAEFPALSGEAVFNAACAFSLASAASDTDDQERERRARKAIDYLQRLQKGGYYEHPKKGKKFANQLNTDKDLAPVRKRKDFQMVAAAARDDASNIRIAPPPREVRR